MPTRDGDLVGLRIGEREGAVPRRPAQLGGPAVHAGFHEALAKCVDIVGREVELDPPGGARHEEDVDVANLEDRDHALLVDHEFQPHRVAIESEEPLEIARHDSHMPDRDDAGHLLAPPEVGVLPLDPILARRAEDVDVVNIFERESLVRHV